MPPAPILLVEDEAATVALVSSVLQSGGFTVSVAGTAAKARAALEKGAPLMVILDRQLPDADGIELCAEIRQKPRLKNLPVLFLTAKKTAADRVDGLTTGGDDYLTKPFSPAELLARVQAILRRSGAAERPTALEAGRLKLDLRSRRAFLRDKQIELWAREFDLLALLIGQPDKALSREFILQQVWGSGPEDQPNPKVVDVTISNLRVKLSDYGDRIVAVRGFGYRFDAEPPAA